MRKVIKYFSLFVIFIIVSACGTNNEVEEQEETVTSVETAQVKKDDLQVSKTMYGTIIPFSQMPVMVEQPGEITEIFVKNGENISKDTTVAKVKTPMGTMDIKAPRDGKVAKLHAQTGDLQSNEEPLMVIADTDTMKMNVAVSDQDRDLFKEDKEVTIHIDGDKYKGIVLPVDPLPNDAGQFTIEVEIDNEDEHISPGATGKIVLKETKVKNSIIVPTEAILQEADEDYIYIVKDGKAERVVVEIIETQTEFSAIKGDVKEKDEVIVNGHFTLTDGSEVEVVKDGNDK